MTRISSVLLFAIIFTGVSAVAVFGASDDRIWTDAVSSRDVDPDPAVQKVVDAVSSAVVSITTYKKGENNKEEKENLGTGFLIHAAGYILTNDHVVRGSDRFVVSFPYPDGTHEERNAVLIGSDEGTDIALLLADGGAFPQPLILGSENSIRRGSRVIAIGNPFGLSDSVSVGFIASKHREIRVSQLFDNCEVMQVDIGINPGNSGGPLLNMKGEVVGIVSAVNPKGNSMGFAIPIEIVRLVLPQLHKRGMITRGSLGASFRELDGTMAAGMGLRLGQALALESVESGSPADIAGLKPGDLILKAGGQPVGSVSNFRCNVVLRRPGTMLSLQVRRGGKTFDVFPVLGEAKTPVPLPFSILP